MATHGHLHGQHAHGHLQPLLESIRRARSGGDLQPHHQPDHFQPHQGGPANGLQPPPPPPDAAYYRHHGHPGQAAQLWMQRHPFAVQNGQIPGWVSQAMHGIFGSGGHPDPFTPHGGDGNGLGGPAAGGLADGGVPHPQPAPGVPTDVSNGFRAPPPAFDPGGRPGIPGFSPAPPHGPGVGGTPGGQPIRIPGQGDLIGRPGVPAFTPHSYGGTPGGQPIGIPGNPTDGANPIPYPPLQGGPSGGPIGIPAPVGGAPPGGVPIHPQHPGFGNIGGGFPIGGPRLHPIGGGIPHPGFGPQFAAQQALNGYA